MPVLDAVSNGVDVTGNFMTRRDRKLYAWPFTVNEQRIGMTDAARLHRNPHIAGLRFRQNPVDEIQWSSWREDLS
ncbi:MAG: hypothetical protein QOC63_3205 [Mycobacterium sp.]|jgi:hypothetical protein|nr:hypothetical protein [Mycobacterium sp.]